MAVVLLQLVRHAQNWTVERDAQRAAALHLQKSKRVAHGDGGSLRQTSATSVQDSRAEQREERRRIEAALQEEYATRRVRSVDELGRAYATGRRKTSVAQVWIWPGPGSFSVNRRPLDMHFTQLERRNDVLAPFEVRRRPLSCQWHCAAGF